MIVERTFVDTNILVYAYDSESEAKHERARDSIRSLWTEGNGVVSTQVLQEFYVTVTRKIPVPLAAHLARDIISTYRAWPVHQPAIDELLAASELGSDHGFSFWDSLMLVSAHRSGATSVLTEDLHHGQLVLGMVITNPFRV